MRIALFNLEPQYCNLALEKIRCYYELQGYDVEDYFALRSYDKIYCSSIFTWTSKDRVPPGAVCGGSGFDLKTVLPDEMEKVEPHLNFGFTTRGCIRNCSFCIVPLKEGRIYITGDLLGLWDGEVKDIRLLDNNILALPKHFEFICRQAQEHHLRLDFTQGLDHRLLTPSICQLLASIRHKEYHFAFDSPNLFASVQRAINLLREVGISRSIWYVLVGYNTTLEQDLARLNFLREYKQRAFVQRYNLCQGRKDYQVLADWANQHRFFATHTFSQFLDLREDRRLLKMTSFKLPNDNL